MSSANRAKTTRWSYGDAVVGTGFERHLAKTWRSELAGPLPVLPPIGSTIDAFGAFGQIDIDNDSDILILHSEGTRRA